MKKGSSLLVLVPRCDHTNGINFILFYCLFVVGIADCGMMGNLVPSLPQFARPLF